MNKQCIKCIENKNINDFRFMKSTQKYLNVCKSCEKEYKKEYRKNNKNKIKAYMHEYRKENKERIVKYKKEYEKQKFATDTKYKLIHSIRNRIRIALSKNCKTSSSESLLGCSLDEYKFYLESKFKEGMNWGNWSRTGWHIDHIKPCSSFDLSDPNQQKECFHYSNTQPLWAKNNLAKGKNY